MCKNQAQHMMAVEKFKTKCLQELAQVKQSGEPLIITHHGKPMVKIIPIVDEEKATYFGCLKDSAHIVGDIALLSNETWNAEQGEF